MPDRPQDPNDPAAYLNRRDERIRALERRVLELPEGSKPLQTFESGSPLGDTRFLDFGDNITATLIGDGFVRITGGGGGPGGWDAIVDGTIGSSDPANRLFLGIGEALNYLLTTVGLTQRAMVLVRAHPTSSSVANEPTGNTYVETANVIAPNETFIVSSTWFAGAMLSGVGVAPRWDHDGYTVDTNTGAGVITCLGLSINGKEEGVSGVNKSALFQSDVVLVDCFVEPGTMLTSSSRYAASTTVAYMLRCSMQNGWLAASEYYDCDMRIFTGGTYDPFLASTNRCVMDRCYVRNATLFGAPCTWTLGTNAISSVHLHLLPARASGSADLISVTLELSSAKVYYIELQDSAGWWAVTNPSAACTARLEGRGFAGVTLGVPATGTKHSVDVQDCNAADITGPAIVDIETASAITLRGAGIAGTIMTSRASGTAISFVNGDQSALVVSGSSTAGTVVPVNFDASSTNNVVVFGGIAGYAAAVDSGSGNVILPSSTGASPAPNSADYLVGTAQAGLTSEIVVGATPGGELGGTWASPTVDTTHSGSPHHIVEDEGVALTARQSLNFTGSGVTAADSGGKTVVTVPGVGTPTAGWGSITNVTPDRAYDANSTTLDEIADVLGTLVADLIAQGVIAT